MKLSVFGVGYVGLVSAACFAELGNDVLCCDTDEAKLATLAAGGVPFYEPGLGEIVERNVRDGRLRFTSSAPDAVAHGEIMFVAVGTPPDENGGSDLRFVRSVAESIGDHLSSSGRIVVMKSTVPVGTAVEVRRIVTERLRVRGADLEFAVVSNPEFLKEGEAVGDFMKPDRIVVGAEEEWARELMRSLYLPFVKNGHPVQIMGTASAELAKYAANALLATKISFMNQIAEICERTGADIEEIRAAVAADRRIGPHFLYAGIGYGGSCFPKDVQALAATARGLGTDTTLIDAIEKVNEKQKQKMAAMVARALGGVQGKQIAIWGLAFKPRTDDMRSAPSIAIIEDLLREGARVHAYDPVAMPNAQAVFGDRIVYAADMYAALDGADALIIVTEWPQFKEPDIALMASRMSGKHIFDGRNIYDPARIRGAGFSYTGIGRPVQ